MQCGPCPVRAVKNGFCRTKYDCGFIFSEVNADEVTWLTYYDGGKKKEKILEIETTG